MMVDEDMQKHYAQFAQNKLAGTPLAPMRFEGRTDASLLGYGQADLQTVPKASDTGLSCGNPLLHAPVVPGATVVDLGCGAGRDCFIAADKVGASGRVIGVDATPDMVELARRNAREGGYGNVEFLLADVEDLPIEDGTADVVISNCTMHLARDGGRAFAQAYRILHTGGCLCISDIVLTGQRRATLNDRTKGYEDCLSHAVEEQKYLDIIGQAGFADVTVVKRETWPFFRGYASICVTAYRR